ncbi:hypothetical protein PROFUN_12811 [Planoprotostelium fungivorum]|uniref:Uncharacterized protein n=1 Tax=Planoprotostelium fungivorum TaxID=1890364 RepID=A0A2P6N6P4_9EUKA|nr:hypothetical protein PROFUN_12811 [Planoprotostelium fungivorum]
MATGTPNDPNGFVEDELQRIREMFEKGEMQAFGVNQKSVMNELQRIRELQALVAERQMGIAASTVKYLSEEADTGPDEHDLFQEQMVLMDNLSESMNTICDSITQVQRIME